MDFKHYKLASTLPKHDSKLQTLAITTLEEFYPVLDQWYLAKSKNALGFEISVRYQLTALVRNLWRAIQLGEACNEEFIAQGTQHMQTVRFDWTRASTKLLESIFSLNPQTKQSIPINMNSKIKNIFLKIKNIFDLLQLSLEYEKKWLFLSSQFFVLWKKLDNKKSISVKDLKRNTLNLLFFRPSLDTKRMLLAAKKYMDWNLLSLGAVTEHPIKIKWDAQEVNGLLENLKQKIDSKETIKPLTKLLIKDCLQHFVHSAPGFWGHARTIYESFNNVPQGIPCAFVAHPDMSNMYLAYLAACNARGIPVLEVQHGCQHIRYNHSVSFAWRNLPDFYLTFGAFTDFNQEQIVERKKIVQLFKHKVNHVAGVFWRSSFFRLIKKRPKSIKKILFGSYFLGDFDECEFFWPDQDIVEREVAIITELAKHSDLEVYVKIRPTSTHSITKFLPNEVLSKIIVIDIADKAGHSMMKEYDAVVCSIYATMMLEATSLGVPFVYCPSAKERALLLNDFVDAIKNSPNEVRMLEDISGLYQTLKAFAGTAYTAQTFSTRYARYATEEAMKQVFKQLFQEVIQYTPQ